MFGFSSGSLHSGGPVMGGKTMRLDTYCTYHICKTHMFNINTPRWFNMFDSKPRKKTHHHRFCCQNNYLLWRRHGPRHAILPGRIAWWQLGGWDAEGTGLWSQSREAADGDAPLGAWKTRGKHRGKHVAAMAVKPVTWAAAFIWLNDVKWRIVLYSLVAYPGLSKTS